MTSRPIIFTADEVRATLAGKQGQFRRVMAFRESRGCKFVFYPQTRTSAYLDFDDVPGLGWRPYAGSPTVPLPQERIEELCPYGVPGDHLRVRETWAIVSSEPGCDCEATLCSHEHIEYRADTGNKYPGYWPADEKDHPNCGRWSSSSQMPKWASRLSLKITKVEVEKDAKLGWVWIVAFKAQP
jgi:hypothetical protein